MTDVSFIIGLEHFLGFIGLVLGLVMLVWRLIDRQRKPIVSLEQTVKEMSDSFKIEHEKVHAKLDDHERRIQKRESRDEKLWLAIDSIKQMINDWRAESTKNNAELRSEIRNDHASLSERLARIEVGGCQPSKKDKAN